MKKLLIILLLIISSVASSQTGYYKRIKVVDSIYVPAGIINASGYYLNGVLQTFGGSPFDLTAFHEFTGINVLSNGTYFNDSVKFTKIVIMDSLKVNNRISGYGALIDSLSASYLRTGTIDVARLPTTAYTTTNLDTTRFAETWNTFTTSNLDTSLRMSYAKDSANFLHTASGVWDAIVSVVTFTTIPTVASFFQNSGRTIQYFLPNSASDTLATLNQTQILTNKTISATSNTMTGLTRSIMFFTSAVLSPADAITYVFGSNTTAPEASINRRVYFPVACHIKSCIFTTYTNGAGDTNSVTLAVRLNNTTDYNITTSAKWNNNSTTTTYSDTNLNIAIAAGEFIEFKIVCPTWPTTNPTGMRISATISLTE